MLEAVPWENPTYGILGRAAGNVVYGGTVLPRCNRKGGDGNPPPKGARASALPDIRLARELGLVSFGKLSIDGTKVRANASKRKAMRYERMAEAERRLKEEIREVLRRAGKTDAEDDARFGEANRGDEVPEELRRRQTRLAAIQAAHERLEAEQRAVSTTPGDGNRDRIGIRREGRLTSGPTGNRIRSRRATSRIRRAGS